MYNFCIQIDKMHLLVVYLGTVYNNNYINLIWL